MHSTDSSLWKRRKNKIREALSQLDLNTPRDPERLRTVFHVERNGGVSGPWLTYIFLLISRGLLVLCDLVPNLPELVAPALWIASTRSRTPTPLMGTLRGPNPQGNPQSLAPSGQQVLPRCALEPTHGRDDPVFACLASHLSLQ